MNISFAINNWFYSNEEIFGSFIGVFGSILVMIISQIWQSKSNKKNYINAEIYSEKYKSLNVLLGNLNEVITGLSKIRRSQLDSTKFTTGLSKELDSNIVMEGSYSNIPDVKIINLNSQIELAYDLLFKMNSVNNICLSQDLNHCPINMGVNGRYGTISGISKAVTTDIENVVNLLNLYKHGPKYSDKKLDPYFEPSEPIYDKNNLKVNIDNAIKLIGYIINDANHIRKFLKDNNEM